MSAKFFKAIEEGNKDKVERMLRKTPNLILAKDKKKLSPLMVALYYHEFEIANILLDRMDAMAKEKNASLAQLSLAWLLSDPLITSPIIGANSPEQLLENLGALDVQLTGEDREILGEASSWKEGHS